jgi:hypothetical protein
VPAAGDGAGGIAEGALISPDISYRVS